MEFSAIFWTTSAPLSACVWDQAAQSDVCWVRNNEEQTYSSAHCCNFTGWKLLCRVIIDERSVVRNLFGSLNDIWDKVGINVMKLIEILLQITYSNQRHLLGAGRDQAGQDCCRATRSRIRIWLQPSKLTWRISSQLWPSWWNKAKQASNKGRFWKCRVGGVKKSDLSISFVIKNLTNWSREKDSRFRYKVSEEKRSKLRYGSSNQGFQAQHCKIVWSYLISKWGDAVLTKSDETREQQRKCGRNFFV